MPEGRGFFMNIVDRDQCLVKKLMRIIRCVFKRLFERYQKYWTIFNFRHFHFRRKFLVGNSTWEAFKTTNKILNLIIKIDVKNAVM